jgi:hypothetical protein
MENANINIQVGTIFVCFIDIKGIAYYRFVPPRPTVEQAFILFLNSGKYAIVRLSKRRKTLGGKVDSGL